jgi:hypothetical protein
VISFGADGGFVTFAIGCKVYWKGCGVRGEIEWFLTKERAWASLGMVRV